MIEYTVYDPETGVILKNFSFQDASFMKHQDIGDAALIEGKYLSDFFWIKNGEPTNRVEADLTIPAEVDIGDAVSFTLPEDTFFLLDGVKYNGQVMLPTDKVYVHYINLQGAYRGSYTVFVKSYIENRMEAYPSYGEQFDYIYHNGFEAWMQMITDIKNQFPKPA